MPKKQIQFNLDFILNNTSTVCTIKQFDNVVFNVTPLSKGLPYNPQNMTCRLFVGVNKDLFMQIDNITLSENKINIILDKNILQNEGTAYAELELSDSEGAVTSSSFIFNINYKIGEGANVPGMVDDFVTQYEKLIAKLKREVDNTIQKLDSNELLRISSEDIRIQSENERILNETTRSQDEEVRKASEISRVSDEQNRVTKEDARVKSENVRISSEKTRVEDENIRKSAEVIRISNESTRIEEHSTRMGNVDNKLIDVEKRFQTLTTSQQQASEVIDARDNEISLKARLDRDLAKGKIINENVEGTYITVNDSVGGSISNIEILGNTTQDTVDLKDIKSVANLQDDGLYKMSILSCGKNLFDGEFSSGSFSTATGVPTEDSTNIKTDNFIRYKSSGNYTVTVEGISNPNIRYFYYDSNYNFIKYSTSLLNLDNAKYMKFRITSTDINLKVQLEEGTVATTYEPYQYNKSSILLPCQLEKVGDVADRLFMREDGIWCIEKNIETNLLSDFILSQDFGSLTNTYRILFRGAFSKQESICNKLSYNANYGLDEPHFYVNAGLTSGYLFVNQSEVNLKSGNTTLDKISNYLSDNNYFIKFATTTPQIIELPLNTQIQLNSYLGTTNIFTEDTVIEPTIKATVPKSLGASINSLVNKTDNLSQRVENVETLKEGQELEVSTDKGYIVCENTTNGYIEDLKIEGNTLIVNSNNEEVVAGTEGATLKSVGEGVDKIEVLSNNNMVDNSFNQFKDINSINGTETNSMQCVVSNYNYIQNYDTNVKLYEDGTEVNSPITNRFYDKDKKYLGSILTKDVFYVKYRCLKGENYTKPISSYQFKKVVGRVYKSNKKQVLYQNSSGVYEKPILRSTRSISDTIEKHSDGKYYFHKRCGETILSNSITGDYYNIDDAMAQININFTDKFNKTNLKCINNLFNYYTYFENGKEGINLSASGGGYIVIRILKSKLSTQDVAGFKTWLQTNNVTVVYQLATEEVYEVVNLDLDSYQDETSVIVDSGAISPKLTFKIASHIANTISVLKDRINYLEDKVMNMLKAVLSGDAQCVAYELYPEDFQNNDIIEEETIEGTELL